MHMITERAQRSPLLDEHYERAAQLANVILAQSRYKGFSDDELYVSLKMVRLRLERDSNFKVSRWDENGIDWHLAHTYLLP